MTSFNDKINQQLSLLTKSQKVVAAYYLTNLNSVAFDNLDTTARKMNISTTTVLRFARSLGYKGFSDMQEDIQKEILNKASLPERLVSLQNHINTANHLLMDSVQNDIDNITKTFSQIDPAALNSAVSRINDAQTVYILGLRSSFALAHYMTSRLAQIRPHVRLIEGSGMLYLEDFGGVNKEDVVVAFLFPRYSKMSIDLLTWLKKKQIPVIIITSGNIEKIQDLGDLFIPCYVNSVSFKNSFAAPVALANYIAAATAIIGHDRALETVKETEDFLDSGYYLGR